MKFKKLPSVKKIFLLLIICIISFSSLCNAYPQRIVSTMPSITEILFALGVGDKVVGVTLNCNYPKEAAKKEKIGLMNINLEKIISLKPDMIIMLKDSQLQDVERLKSRKLPVITINPHSIKDVFKSIEYIGSITGSQNRAQRLASDLRYRLAMVSSRDKNVIPKSVLVMVGYKPLISAGKANFINDVIEKAGGVNAIKSKAAYPQINFEELYRLDPDVIIIPKSIMGASEIKRDNKLARLSAVQNGKILWVDSDVLFRPGPRIVDAVEIVARFLNK